jgi:hypothetical protein
MQRFLGTTDPLLSAGRSFPTLTPQTLSFISVIVTHKLRVSSEWPVVFAVIFVVLTSPQGHDDELH